MENQQLVEQSKIVADYRPHPITDEGRILIQIDPGITLERALRPLMSLDVPFVAYVNGNVYSEQVWGEVVLKTGDVVNVRAVMQGDNINPLAAILAVVVLVAAPFLAPVIGNAIGVTSAIGLGIIEAAIGIAGILIVNALFPPRLPDFDAGGGPGQPDQQFSISGGANRTRLYEPLPLVLGTHRVFPDYASREYTDFDDENDQFLNQIFEFGIGNLQVNEIKIGDTPLSSLSDAEVQQHPNLRNIVIDGVSWSTVTIVSGNVDTIQGGEVEREMPIVRETADRTKQIAVDMISQHFRAEDDGSLDGRSVTFDLEWRPANSNRGWGRNRFIMNTPNGAEARNPVRRSIVIGNDQLFSWFRDLDADRGLSWELRVVLVTSHDEDDSRLTFRQNVGAFRAYQDAQTNFHGRNPLAMRIRATGQLYGRLDSVNAEVSQLIDRWDGAAWIPNQVTSNPGDILLAYYRGWYVQGRLAAGMGLPDSRIDFDSIQRFSEHCRDNDLECNMVLLNRQDHAETLKTICQCGWGSVDAQSGKWGVLWENSNRPMTAIITPSNVIADSVAVSYESDGLADEVIGVFIDKESDYQNNQIRRNVPGVDVPVRPVEIRLTGIIKGEHAAKEVNRIVAAQFFHYRTITWEMELDEGMAISRGDVVGAAHGLLGEGIGGRLTSIGQNRVEITTTRDDELDALISIPDGDSFAFASCPIWIWDLNGVITVTNLTKVKFIPDTDRPEETANIFGIDTPIPEPETLDGADDPLAYRFMVFPNSDDLVKLRVTSKAPSGTTRIRFVARDEVTGYYTHRNSDLSWNPLGEGARPQNIPVAALSATQNFLGTRIFSWPPHPEALGYELRYAEAGSEEAMSFDTMRKLHDGLITGTELQLSDRPDGGRWTFAVVAVFIGGMRSEPAFATQLIVEVGERIANSTWHFGSGEPNPALGNNGNRYLNEADNTIWVKTNDVWVMQSSLAGADGATWLTGTTPPLNSLGEDGDFYMNTTDSQVFRKDNGAWTAVVNIAGTHILTGQGEPPPELGVTRDLYFRTDNGYIYQKVSHDTWRFRSDLTGPQGDSASREGLFDQVDILQNTTGAGTHIRVWDVYKDNLDDGPAGERRARIHIDRIRFTPTTTVNNPPQPSSTGHANDPP